MRKIIFVIMSIILLNGCATLPSKKIPKNYEPINSNGLVIGAIAFDKNAKKNI